MQYWSSLHRPSIYIPLSAWTLHMPHMACPYAICHMPKYGIFSHIWAYLGIWHIAYGLVILGMWGVQALSGMYIDGLWRLDQYCIALSKVMAQTKICNFPPYKWDKFMSKSTKKSKSVWRGQWSKLGQIKSIFLIFRSNHSRIHLGYIARWYFVPIVPLYYKLGKGHKLAESLFQKKL